MKPEPGIDFERGLPPYGVMPFILGISWYRDICLDGQSSSFASDVVTSEIVEIGVTHLSVGLLDKVLEVAVRIIVQIILDDTLGIARHKYSFVKG